MAALNTEISEELKRTLKAACARLDVSLKDAVAAGIEWWLASSGEEATPNSGSPEIVRNTLPAPSTKPIPVVSRIVSSATSLLRGGRSQEVERLADLMAAMEAHGHTVSPEAIIERAKEVGRSHLGDALAPMPTEDPARATRKAGKRTG